MTTKEIKALSIESLTTLIQDEKKALQRKKFTHAIAPVENPMSIRLNRRLIAKLQTELTARLNAK